MLDSLFDFRNPAGRDIVARCEPLAHWVDRTSSEGLFPFLRHHEHAPDVVAEVMGFGGQRYAGINLASQDYLGLSKHPAVRRAAAEACFSHGTHSAGSEPMGGGFADARHLEREIGAFVDHQHVVLFPTGWGAGYGAIKALIRPADHVVIDALAHDCLQQGAHASTPHVSRFAHNNVSSLSRRLERIRRTDGDSAILVVTESLFSMDSDHPDFRAVIGACRAFDARLLVDVAHDLGAVGPAGRGVLAQQGVLADVDVVMGSFSKTFACLGGFVATHSKAASYYVRAFSGTYTFSNYLIPAQVAAIRAALAVVASTEGDARRQATLERARVLRAELLAGGLTTIGCPSPIVMAQIGSEAEARLAYRTCLERGVIVNSIEYPACQRGTARFRMQVSPDHPVESLRSAAAVIADAARSAARGRSRDPHRTGVHCAR